MKLDQKRFNIIKKHLSKQNSKTLKQTAKRYGLSVATIRNLANSDNFANYKINIRANKEPSSDWLTDLGYEKTPIKDYVRRLKSKITA